MEGINEKAQLENMKHLSIMQDICPELAKINPSFPVVVRYIKGLEANYEMFGRAFSVMLLDKDSLVMLHLIQRYFKRRGFKALLSVQYHPYKDRINEFIVLDIIKGVI